MTKNKKAVVVLLALSSALAETPFRGGRKMQTEGVFVCFFCIFWKNNVFLPERGLTFVRMRVILSGDSVYVYSNLKGQKGDTGLDGASLVNARLNDNGELILEVPDDVDNEDLSRLLTFESGVITLNDMRTITDNITRLNNKVRELEETIEELKSSIVNR